MNEAQNSRQYDLEERTLRFARDVRLFINSISKNLLLNEDGKQLIRSSGSIGANYIEANEALSKKDFVLRIKISRKEAKETIYWLHLLEIAVNKPVFNSERLRLLQEATELMKIFSSIMRKSQ